MDLNELILFVVIWEFGKKLVTNLLGNAELENTVSGSVFGYSTNESDVIVVFDENVFEEIDVFDVFGVIVAIDDSKLLDDTFLFCEMDEGQKPPKIRWIGYNIEFRILKIDSKVVTCGILKILFWLSLVNICTMLFLKLPFWNFKISFCEFSKVWLTLLNDSRILFWGLSIWDAWFLLANVSGISFWIFIKLSWSFKILEFIENSVDCPGIIKVDSVESGWTLSSEDSSKLLKLSLKLPEFEVSSFNSDVFIEFSKKASDELIAEEFILKVEKTGFVFKPVLTWDIILIV